NERIYGANLRLQTRIAARQIRSEIARIGINVNLVYVVSDLDLRVAIKLVEARAQPTVIWISDLLPPPSEQALIRRLWSEGDHRIAISEAMREYLAASAGGPGDVLDNSASFADEDPPPPAQRAGPLRVIYAGALHNYYKDVFPKVAREVSGMRESVQL